MKTRKHLTLEQKKVISNGISRRYTLKKIAENIGYDLTSISKEIKINREIISLGSPNIICEKHTRWPYICSHCNKKYNNQCCLTKYKYNAEKAQKKADYNLTITRKVIDINSSEFESLDNLIKEGTENKKSIYQITIENKDIINKSVTIIYRYINSDYLKTKRIDLPYAVKYKNSYSSKQAFIKVFDEELLSKLFYLNKIHFSKNVNDKIKCGNKFEKRK